MTGQWIRFILGTLFLALGIFFIVSSVVGNYRFKFALNRMHSAALGDTLGLGGIVAGMCFYHGLNATTVKLLIIVALVWITSPVASHLIMLMEFTSGKYSSAVHEETSDEQGLEHYSVDMKRSQLEKLRAEEKEEEK